MNDEDLLARSLDGLLTEAESQELGDRLRTDPALAQRLMELSREEALLRDVAAALPARPKSVAEQLRYWGMITMAASLLAVASIFWLMMSGPHQDPKKTDVQAWCEDLGSDDLEKRDTATRELVKRGKTILPDIERLLKSDSAEVRARAGAIRDEIRKNRIAKGLTLEAVMAKKSYAPGEMIQVDLVLKNIEDFPIAIVALDAPVLQMTSAAGMSVVKDGKTLQVQVPPQTGYTHREQTVDEKEFKILKPGETLRVDALRFDGKWDRMPTMGGTDPGLHTALVAGAYRIKGGFSSEPPKSVKRCTDEARKLLNEAWSGHLDVDQPFDVE